MQLIRLTQERGLRTIMVNPQHLVAVENQIEDGKPTQKCRLVLVGGIVIYPDQELADVIHEFRKVVEHG